MQKEITETSPLLLKTGALAAAGYAKCPVFTYSRAQIRANPLRVKEWDYYIVSNGRYAVALTIADNSYMGLISASLLDFENRTEHTESVMTAFPMGRLRLPETSDAGVTRFENKRVRMSFENTGEKRRLFCEFENFKDTKKLCCEIFLSDFPKQSMVIATPFKEDRKAFYLNQKINCMRAEGAAEFDGRHFGFSPDDSFGTLDWGRGVWTYSNTWYWGSASGLVDGKRFGMNLGYGFGDTSAASENMLFYDGAAHKLDQVTFRIPGDETGSCEFLKPWRFTSNDGRLELDFTPVLDRAAYSSVLFLKSDQHQVFGLFSGKAVLDDGRVLQVEKLPGFAEKVINRW